MGPGADGKVGGSPGLGCPVRPQHLPTQLAAKGAANPPMPHATFKALFTQPQSPAARHGTRCSPASSLCKKYKAPLQVLGQVFTHFPGTDKLQGWTFPALFCIQKINSAQKKSDTCCGRLILAEHQVPIRAILSLLPPQLEGEEKI